MLNVAAAVGQAEVLAALNGYAEHTPAQMLKKALEIRARKGQELADKINYC